MYTADPFANIAHGCSSVLATRAALRLGEYCVTEAGFGADLGAEKFLDIKCRASGLWPDAAVVVATVRALKLHGGAEDNLSRENLDALKRGLPNLLHHIRTLQETFSLPVVVALNQFESDSPAEIKWIENACRTYGVPVALSRVWEQGGAGGVDMAQKIIDLTKSSIVNGIAPHYAYDSKSSLREKLLAITQRVYGGADVSLTPQAEQDLAELEGLGFGSLPVCVAKTQYSLSDDAKKLGAPKDFTLTVRALRISAGAGFVVALAGNIMTMPGLPRHPAAENIDIAGDGRITGLF